MIGKETVPGFRRMLFGKRCKFTNEEDRTMVCRVLKWYGKTIVWVVPVNPFYLMCYAGCICHV